MKPDCYKCKYIGEVAGSAHSKCGNYKASVKGDPYGIKSGWFFWPLNFDPTWLEECDGFEEEEK